MLVTDVIVRDHRIVQALFFEVQTAPSGSREPLNRLLMELDVHAQVEEAVVYPALRDVSRRIDDAEAAHEHVRTLMAAVQRQEPGSPEFLAMLLQFKQAVLNHAMEEEAGMFMDAQRLGLERLEELGAAMEQQKQQLMAAGDRRRAA
jgi:hemerythrin superfamily protein